MLCNKKRTAHTATKAERNGERNICIIQLQFYLILRFQSREQEIKYDLKKLLNAQQKVLTAPN